MISGGRILRRELQIEECEERIRAEDCEGSDEKTQRRYREHEQIHRLIPPIAFFNPCLSSHSSTRTSRRILPPVPIVAISNPHATSRRIFQPVLRVAFFNPFSPGSHSSTRIRVVFFNLYPRSHSRTCTYPRSHSSTCTHCRLHSSSTFLNGGVSSRSSTRASSKSSTLKLEPRFPFFNFS